MKQILILCTGNSCRSQMAEGFLKSLDSNLKVFSAGTNPAARVSSIAIKVMNEIGIDISDGVPESVEKYLTMPFDFVITVCNHAKETCPIFISNVKEYLHIGFEDPADAAGGEEEVLAIYRKVRDEIKRDFYNLYLSKIKNS
ncbi:MAG: arsenate reductase ArsC [Ignavibacteriaceae bacterium]|nr:arsenate reductase ArsC [Ignavibacteriaceae bacterium]